MKAHNWLRLLGGIAVSLILYGCLIGTPPVGIPSVNTLSANTGPVRVTSQPFLGYLPQISQSVQTTLDSSNSIYITTLDSTVLFNEGCKLGTRDLNEPGRQDSVVVLHFSYPRMVNNQFGANIYGVTPAATNDEIAAAVQQYGYGYWYCVGADFDSHLQIGVGTSNYGGSIYSSVTYGHGQAWARMVNDVNTWFLNRCPRGCDGQVSAVGANDLELSWDDYAHSVDWLNGYDSANNYPLYNFGALPGCPYLKSPGAQCGGGGFVWTKDQVWTVTYGLSPVFPLPEIYSTNGVNAQQWYLMSVFSYLNKGLKMEFIGVMSQYQACLQRGGCTGLNNTSDQARQELYTLLNDDVRTAGENLPYMTDIFWLGEPIPGSLALLQPGQPAPPASSSGAVLVNQINAALQSSRINAAGRANLEEKLRLIKKLSVPVRSIPPGRKPTLQTLIPNLQNGTSLPAQEEILRGSEGLVHTWEASIQNMWQGQRNGAGYQVLAGASANDPTQGLLLVIEIQPAANLRSQHFYNTPEKIGSLSIQSVQGTRLLLLDAHGGKWSFDLASRAFIKQ